MRLDGIDRTIIAHLTEDARRSYADIARDVNLSPPAVKRRVDRLRAGGAIAGFSTSVNHAALGWNLEVLLLCYCGPLRATTRDALAEILSREPEVLEAWNVGGEADVIVRARLRDAADLERFLLKLYGDGIVEHTKTNIVLSRLVERRG
ncbi:MAG: AsnC family transcriptional regulator [Streptosporangiales bacterium]|nr:AsnC family transcriptional regulator [Streptosporangiales bacterium]